MTTFRTPLVINPSLEKVGLADPIITMGSCFSDTIGGQLLNHKFNVMSNPAGVLFNPVSIHKTLQYIVDNETPPVSSFRYNQDLWSNLDFHSSFSAPVKDIVHERIATTVSRAHQFLKTSKVLIITPGTAWVYEHIETKQVVANCHKLPAVQFRKKLLSVAEIVRSFGHLYASLKLFNPGLKIIFTESPVRHLKDTFELNAVSKSVIRLAIHEIGEQFEVGYFPAYELMLDDLRDYRFYDSDMLHPSEEAIGYIWEKFSLCYFDAPTQEFIRRWHSVAAALKHTAFHPASDSHQRFLKDTLGKLEELKSFVGVEEEIKLISAQLL